MWLSTMLLSPRVQQVTDILGRLFFPLFSFGPVCAAFHIILYYLISKQSPGDHWQFILKYCFREKIAGHQVSVYAETPAYEEKEKYLPAIYCICI